MLLERLSGIELNLKGDAKNTPWADGSSWIGGPCIKKGDVPGWEVRSPLF